MRITRRQLRRIIREEANRARASQRQRRRRLYEAPGRYRTVSPEELDHILQQHELWLGTDWSWENTDPAQGERANFIRPIIDLSGVDLSGANLKLAWFAYVPGADFSGADLSQTIFRGADCTGTDFSGANLTKATMTNAWLLNANLSGADLTGTSLLSANLTGTQFDATTKLQQCRDFRYSTCSPDVLPWLAQHPEWPKWKDTLEVEGMTPEEVAAYSSDMSDTVVEARIRNALKKYTR